jgi:hypothetical protein
VLDPIIQLIITQRDGLQSVLYKVHIYTQRVQQYSTHLHTNSTAVQYTLTHKQYSSTVHIYTQRVQQYSSHLHTNGTAVQYTFTHKQYSSTVHIYTQTVHRTTQ